jgi:hypothetical protein
MARPDPEPPAVEVSPTGRVILGMIALGRRTGYDIKAFVDKTARYFWELRDEGMLKLFFSDSLPERRIDIVRAMRAREERALAHLRSIEPHASQGPAGPYLTLQMGIELTEWAVKWCEATERQLAAETEQE